MSYNVIIIEKRPTSEDYDIWEPHGMGDRTAAGLGTAPSMDAAIQNVTERTRNLNLTILTRKDDYAVLEYGDDDIVRVRSTAAEALQKLEKAQATVDTLVESLSRCKADWKTNADVYVKYITSLWDELAELKREKDQHGSTQH